ncbi:MAG TPA: ATP-binding protein [Phenylobacterium sp.]|uniref:sensor histidine kinase n=1 Tax=Phenylobacterium sp. TaxID=1871053 RepID=UPI002CF79179|nr:ATP-binding protein [Phenylobacterium sp.]HSV03971.1 ATP-binding protein [Phenylobacterium sp.]
MASKPPTGAAGFALGASLRAAAIGLVAFGGLLALQRGLWATAAVLGGVLALVALDLMRSMRSADRTLARFVEGLAAEGYERPAPQAGLRQAHAAMGRALERLAEARAERQRRIDHLEALSDNVAAALLVVDETGQVASANRAARQGLGAQPGPLAAIPALPPVTAARLRALPAGAREIVRLADGRAMLAQAASFAAEGRRLMLISLQSVSGELDAVELKAWQDLVRVLAHEMMNSLTPICSLSESLGERLRDPAADRTGLAEDLEVIARRSQGLMHFVERYRRLSELPKPEPETIRAVELARRLDRLMGPTMREAGVDYASVVTPKALRLRADPELVEQALINLLKNALEAVRGRPGAAVRLGVQLDEERVALVVEDNGPGLPADDPDAVFVPFFSTKDGGSGVGLTLARQVALAHGGRLEHHARPGGGAVFKLVLPG